MQAAQVQQSVVYELRFPYIHSSKALSFPCDAQGHVQLEVLSERARNNYFYARAMLGREFLVPQVQLV